MYFNNEKENTNIDDEFDNGIKFKFNFSKFKIPLIIFGGIVLIIIAILFIVNIIGNKTEYYILLEGNETITIYQGNDYNEPGYRAIDAKRNNLTDQVIVDNQVNTDVIGEYKVIYKLNGVSKTRYVNVIKKPIGETSIYLLGVNGDINVYLKVGEKYVEPGYNAIDTVDGNLNNKVKIDSNVDTSKAGTYRIIYTVVNSSGITKSVTRTVVVKK